jgi:hypothetical protein
MSNTRRLNARLSYKDMVEHYGLKLCTDFNGCRRKVSQVGHRYGKADSMGFIHLQDGDTKKVTKRGMRQLLRMIAIVKLRHLRGGKPQWLRIYEMDTWAFHEGYDTWHVRFPSEWSDADRGKVMWLASRAGVSLRSDHTPIYRWASTPFYRKKESRHDDR